MPNESIIRDIAIAAMQGIMINPQTNAFFTAIAKKTKEPYEVLLSRAAINIAKAMEVELSK